MDLNRTIADESMTLRPGKILKAIWRKTYNRGSQIFSSLRICVETTITAERIEQKRSLVYVKEIPTCLCNLDRYDGNHNRSICLIQKKTRDHKLSFLKYHRKDTKKKTKNGERTIKTIKTTATNFSFALITVLSTQALKKQRKDGRDNAREGHSSLSEENHRTDTSREYYEVNIFIEGIQWQNQRVVLNLRLNSSNLCALTHRRVFHCGFINIPVAFVASFAKRRKLVNTNCLASMPSIPLLNNFFHPTKVTCPNQTH